MKVHLTKKTLNSNLLIFRNDRKTIGLVPTMGALHIGHLELVKKAKESTDVVVVSIYVNPTQFNNPADFEKYPKTLDKDLEILDKIGVNIVFTPENQEIYPSNPKLRLNFGLLEEVLEGAFRPGHFNGVGIVVSKLLNIVKPDVAFFGQKDLQQVAIIKRLVSDLSFDVKIDVVRTVREADGLAFSSRNMRLNPNERMAALVLSKALFFAKSELLRGVDWLTVKNQAVQLFESEPLCRLEYFELVDPNTFKILESFNPRDLSSICTAAYVGEVRLIDNLPIID
ncbi:Pantoate--beta-alanine ligase [Mariniradius saccharolyticus AK6]|uniref:Pantothenate synthetase n=1 Tax=Mariniradius saccharolyticus AK6 TaxID=1239962 RepID=M7XBS1_9BACT|nr:pantoate--beta-alanine ligase [Mariniradius saccharolyticus]EMS32063.1 Pantoate--beta-alanine ligase [Mariniradius saccharolyticus AK6]